MIKNSRSIQEYLNLFNINIGCLNDKLRNAQSAFVKAGDVKLATTPYSIVYQEDRIKLKHYGILKSAQQKLNTPLLVVYALVNRETMLDLNPTQSVVKALMANGVDLYMIDWGYPTYNDKYLTIGDHVLGYMNNVVDCIRKRSGVKQLNIMGICMGGTLSLMYSALFPGKVKNLVLTVTPANFETREGLLHQWVSGLDVDTLVDTHGNIPGYMLNLIFLMLSPVRLMIEKYVIFLEHSSDPAFTENFLRMEKWIFDCPDVPGETFRQFITDCYQNNLLINSKMNIDGHRIDLKNISMPLLNITADYDMLVPTSSCYLPKDKTGSNDTETVCLKTGHIGIYVSRKTQQHFTPKIVNWLRVRD